jgi:hypothetical protein
MCESQVRENEKWEKKLLRFAWKSGIIMKTMEVSRSFISLHPFQITTTMAWSGSGMKWWMHTTSKEGWSWFFYKSRLRFEWMHYSFFSIEKNPLHKSSFYYFILTATWAQFTCIAQFFFCSFHVHLSFCVYLSMRANI